jgi:hypothetical protein
MYANSAPILYETPLIVKYSQKRLIVRKIYLLKYSFNESIELLFKINMNVFFDNFSFIGKIMKITAIQYTYNIHWRFKCYVKLQQTAEKRYIRDVIEVNLFSLFQGDVSYTI